MALPEEPFYTTDCIFSLPEGQRAELIDGRVCFLTSPPPSFHSRLVSRIGHRIESFLDQHGGPCKVYSAPCGVFLNRDDKNYFEPDLSVICDPNVKVDDTGCHGAPDWIIEIVSPSTRAMDYYIKLNKYETAGVREYWIVDPPKGRITAWDLLSLTVKEYSFEDRVPSIIFPDLSIDFRNLNL